jgi:hypothetical protein
MHFTKKLSIIVLLAYLYLLFTSCQKDPETPVKEEGFETVPVKKALSGGVLDEISGLAPGIKVPGFLWAHEDSDQPAEISLLSSNGEIVKKLALPGVVNRDWEDIASGPGPDAAQSYLYIAETGDNNQVYDKYFIYRVEEPSAAQTTIATTDKIAFTYPDGKHDAEAIFLDPSNKDIYIVTKRDTKSKLFKLTYPYSATSDNTVTEVATLPYNQVTGADLSSDRKMLLIRTYGNIYYYPVGSGATIASAVAAVPQTLTFEAEPQGESVAFSSDLTGYYTISEKLLSSTVTLNFYKKK